MKLSEMMEARPIIRGGLIAPSVVVVIFTFFNLTAIVDRHKAVQVLKLGIVNQDEGAAAPGGEPLRIADRALAAMERQMPMGTSKFPDEASATAALDNGEVVGVLLFPADFSRTITSGGTAQARLLNSDHLSLLETQIGRNLSVQLQAGLALAAVVARAQPASPAAQVPPVTGAPVEAPPEPVPPRPANPGPAAAQAGGAKGLPPPPVLLTAAALHPVTNSALLQAPFVMSFASWMASLVGAFLLFLGTRPLLGPGNVGPIAVARILIPIVASVAAAFLSVVIVGALTGAWANFFQLWAFRWLATAAATVATALAPRQALLEQKSRFILATNELDAETLPPAELLAAYKGQSGVERGFRFLKDPLFLASSLFLKSPQRIMALLMVMTLCLLVYAALEYRMRQALRTHQQTLPDQKGKSTATPTARWIFQCFVGIHVLILNESEPLVLNLQDSHQRLLALLGPPYEVVYS